MQTVTFYSYKGGVGRTLALANVARYLAQFGQKVYVLDLDLEAPGLHYKLLSQDARSRIERGFVDYLDEFLRGESTLDLKAHTLTVESGAASGGSIHLMPAGRAPSPGYWQRLAHLSWHELFYSEDPNGVPFFLDLKARIAAEYEPDYLLIDARTGITEIGGVATTILPDKLVCILINNQENLEGARAVLRSLSQAPRLPGDPRVEVLPVLARVPEELAQKGEREMVEAVKAFLEEPSDDISTTLTIKDMFVLHTESALQLKEVLKFGVDGTKDTPLLRDYLRLFQPLIPPQVIRDRFQPILQQLLEKAFDEPDAAQRELEALAIVAPHQEVFLALLKFYRLRNAKSDLLLDTAKRVWECGGQDQSLVHDVVASHFKSQPAYTRPSVDLEFIHSVWKTCAAAPKLAIALAESWANSNQPQRAEEVYSALDSADLEIEARTAIVIGRASLKDWDRTLASLTDASLVTALDAEAVSKIGHHVIATGDQGVARKFLELMSDRVHEVRRRDASSWVAILNLAGRGKEAIEAADDLLQKALAAGPSALAIEVGLALDQLGLWTKFETSLRERWADEPELAGFLQETQRRRKHKKSGLARTRRAFF